MHHLTFYPVGNGDSSQIELANKRRILIDYYHVAEVEKDEKRPEINLKAHLKQELKAADRDYFDVVVFTHGDKDHISGSGEFFYLEHSKSHQDEERTRIKELWVPAALVLEEASESARDTRSDFFLLRQEARYRLRTGKGIKVFSVPDELKDFLKKDGLTLEDRQDCFVYAGKTVLGFTLEKDGIEFFCHGPFKDQVDQDEEYRNGASLILHATFKDGSTITRYMAFGDTDSPKIIDDLVAISRARGREDRLVWNLLNIPHHCSYKPIALERGKDTAEPTEGVKSLLLAGQPGAYLISSSDPIPEGNSKDGDYPPHPEAKRCYEKYRKVIGGTALLVTMEHGVTDKGKKPEPIVFEIGPQGVRLKPKEETERGNGNAAKSASIFTSPLLQRATPKMGEA